MKHGLVVVCLIGSVALFAAAAFIPRLYPRLIAGAVAFFVAGAYLIPAW
jgi:hypothetical protein